MEKAKCPICNYENKYETDIKHYEPVEIEVYCNNCNKRFHIIVMPKIRIYRTLLLRLTVCVYETLPTQNLIEVNKRLKLV